MRWDEMNVFDCLNAHHALDTLGPSQNQFKRRTTWGVIVDQVNAHIH